MKNFKNSNSFSFLVLIGLVLFIFPNESTAKAWVTQNGVTVAYDYVSFDDGLTWERACCDNVSPYNPSTGITCTDDCSALTNENQVTPLVFDDQILSSIRYTAFESEEDSVGTKFFAEYKEGKLLLNDVIFGDFTGANVMIQVSLPGLGFPIVMESSEPRQIDFGDLLDFGRGYKAAELLISPNPISTSQAINVESVHHLITSLKVYNPSGVLVYSDNKLNIKTQRVEGDIFNQAGVYMLEINLTEPTRKLYKKVMVLR